MASGAPVPGGRAREPTWVYPGWVRRSWFGCWLVLVACAGKNSREHAATGGAQNTAGSTSSPGGAGGTAGTAGSENRGGSSGRASNSGSGGGGAGGSAAGGAAGRGANQAGRG